MKNIILKIKNESDLFEKYNDEISEDLINYLVKEAKYITDDIKIIVDTKLNIEDIEDKIKKGLLKSYNNTFMTDKVLDSKQLLFFIIGVVFLIFSTFIKYSIIKEIIIIAGWVSIWEVVEISLNIDSQLKINRKVLKKLLNAKIEFKNKK